MTEDLLAAINAGKPRQIVTITTEIDMFGIEEGAIPYTVPLLRKAGRTFADGRIVLKKRLDALVSKNQTHIDFWGNQSFDLADLCLTFEDQVKLQADSPLLTGIRGVVQTQDGLFVAIDAEYVARAVKDMSTFKTSGSEKVVYGVGDKQRTETANNVVLLRYVSSNYIELNADQFNSVNVKSVKKADMIIGRDMALDEIIRDGKVVHKAWSIYSTDLIVPLVQNVFEYNKETYHYNTNVGLYLADAPKDHAEMRALYVCRLNYNSRLYGSNFIGLGNRVLGIASGCAVGAEKK